MQEGIIIPLIIAICTGVAMAMTLSIKFLFYNVWLSINNPISSCQAVFYRVKPFYA